MINRNIIQQEAIEEAEALLNNVNLPLYSELLAVLKDAATIPALQNAPIMGRIRKVIAKAEGR